MRLLKTVHSLNPAGGGVAAAVDGLARAQLAQGHAVEVACLDDPAAPWLAGRPYRVHAFRPPLLPGYGFSPALAQWLRQNIYSYDAVTVEGLWQFHGVAVRAAARRAGVPYVVYPHGMLDPWFRRAYPRKHWKKALYWRLAEGRVLRDAQAVAFTAAEERRLAEGAFQPWRVHGVISPLGLDAPTGEPAARARRWRERFPALAGRRALLFLGRIDPKKGVDLLLDAFATVHPASERADGTAPVLVLAGPESDAHFAARCRARCRDLGLREGAEVVWTGLLDGDWKWAALENADAFVLPSHQENFGYAVVEALAVGTPVLLSERINIWREIVDDGAGLAAADDAGDTRRLLAAHAAWTPAERARRAAAARTCFANRFQLAAAARRQIEILQGAH